MRECSGGEEETFALGFGSLDFGGCEEVCGEIEKKSGIQCMDRPGFVYDRHNAESLYHETWTLKRARHKVGIIESLEPRRRYRKPRVADKFHEKKVRCKWKVDVEAR